MEFVNLHLNCTLPRYCYYLNNNDVGDKAIDVERFSDVNDAVDVGSGDVGAVNKKMFIF